MNLSILYFLFSVAAIASSNTSQVQAPIASQAIALRTELQKNCASCHNGAGEAVRSFGDFSNPNVLMKYINTKDPQSSILYDRVRSDSMPKGKRLSPADKSKLLSAIDDWVRAGAPPFETEAIVTPVSIPNLLKTILQDLSKEPRPELVRYFTVYHVMTKDKLAADLYLQGLSKLLNSLSWSSKIIKPTLLGASGVFKINLHDYGWDETKWNTIVRNYPYPYIESEFSNDDDLAQVIRLARTDQPILRVDWFIANASKPPLYENLLGLPKTMKGIERLVGIDIQANLSRSTGLNISFGNIAVRAGFQESGVSQSNRIIERHNTRYGALWNSYDFTRGSGLKNIFENPLGPVISNDEKNLGFKAFEHDGGEVIFNLPNGLQAYFLMDTKGNYIPQGPIEVVSDPNRSDRKVTNGISCMSCHYQGIIKKQDEISLNEDRYGIFTKEGIRKIKYLYGRTAFFDEQMSLDIDRFLKAQTLAGVKDYKIEPVSSSTYKYEALMDRPTILSELNISLSDLRNIIGPRIAVVLKKDEKLATFLRTLSDNQTTRIRREIFESEYNQLSKFLDTILNEHAQYLNLVKKERVNQLPIVASDFNFQFNDVLIHTGFGFQKVRVKRINSIRNNGGYIGPNYLVEILEGSDRGKFIEGVPGRQLALSRGCLQIENECLAVGDTVLLGEDAQEAEVIGIIASDIGKNLVLRSDFGGPSIRSFGEIFVKFGSSSAKTRPGEIATLARGIFKSPAGTKVQIIARNVSSGLLIGKILEGRDIDKIYNKFNPRDF